MLEILQREKKTKIMIIEPVRDLDMFTIKPSNLDSVCPKMHHKKAL